MNEAPVIGSNYLPLNGPIEMSMSETALIRAGGGSVQVTQGAQKSFFGAINIQDDGKLNTITLAVAKTPTFSAPNCATGEVDVAKGCGVDMDTVFKISKSADGSSMKLFLQPDGVSLAETKETDRFLEHEHTPRALGR